MSFNLQQHLSSQDQKNCDLPLLDVNSKLPGVTDSFGNSSSDKNNFIAVPKYLNWANLSVESGSTIVEEHFKKPNILDNEDEVVVEFETDSISSPLQRSLSNIEKQKQSEKRTFQLTDQDDSYEIYEFVNDNNRFSASFAAPGPIRNQMDIGSFPRLAKMHAPDDQHLLEARDNFINKLKSVWNSVKFGWSVKTIPKFSSEYPIYLLGKVYFSHTSEKMIPDFTGKLYVPNMDAFFRDYASRIWFTYRVNIPPLPMPASSPMPKSGVVPNVRTTDCGWGCMLRTGQMMFAQTLLMHFLGRNWDYLKSQSPPSDAYHRQIIRWFADSPHWTSPFSIHHLIRISNKEPGEWFGPASVCLLFKKALQEAKKLEPQLDSLEIYLVEDRVIHKQDLYELAGISTRIDNDSDNSVEATNKCKSILVLVPMFLGGADGFNSNYRTFLQRIFMKEWSVGMIGGRPKHSVYFLGFQNDGVIFMDPHLSQNVINVNNDDFNVSSYHCLVPKKMSFNRLDPSCALGFYLRSQRQIDQFLKEIPVLSNPNAAVKSYPLVEVVEGKRPNYSHLTESKQSSLHWSKVHHSHQRKSSISSGASNDYVFY